MEIDAGRLQRLDGFLGNVTPTLALQLARAVEIDRLRGGPLPHDQILVALRPKLREAAERLGRTQTPQRLVCVAFEDLLVDSRLRKQRGRIVRSSVAPVWNWLTRVLIPAESEAALDALRQKLMNGGPDFAGGEIDHFQRIAAAAILAALPSSEMSDLRAADAVRALGPDVAADAYDMARMMEMASEVRVLQQTLPRPMHVISDDESARIRAVFEGLTQSHPDCASYIPFFVLGRLDKPWEALRLAGSLSRKVNDVMLSRTDVGAIGETLLSDLEDCVERLSKMKKDDLDADMALKQVSGFANISTGIVRELGIKRDGVWGRRLMQVRGGMSDQMERLIGRAPREISVTLPTARRGGFGLSAKRRMPDLMRTLDPAKAAKAIALAKLIAGSRPHGLAGAFAGLLKQVDEQVSKSLRQYTHDLADEVHGLPAHGQASAAKFVDQAVALTAALDGKPEADTLRRRVQAALVLAEPPGEMVA